MGLTNSQRQARFRAKWKPYIDLARKLRSVDVLADCYVKELTILRNLCDDIIFELGGKSE